MQAIRNTGAPPPVSDPAALNSTLARLVGRVFQQADGERRVTHAQRKHIDQGVLRAEELRDCPRNKKR